MVLVIAAGLVWAGIFYWNNLRGAGPVYGEPPQDIRELIPASSDGAVGPGKNLTNIPLAIADGFSISIFADNVPGARVMAMGEGGMYVSQTSKGTISRIPFRNNAAEKTETILSGLNNPHGLAFDPHDYTILYYAEEHAISRLNVAHPEQMKKVIDLPAGGRHTTRTLMFGPDDRLYVSIGSSCDVCYETHPWLASIVSMERDGSDARVVARGLRNSVFMNSEPITGAIWATEMGRDQLGDNLPPDELNRIVEGSDYGWPICYGQNIHDANFDKNTYIRNPCEDKAPASVEIPAHSAPLGIAFVPEEGWPEDMWYDAIVAYHGSWNRSEPTGYTLVRHRFDAHGNYQGARDFITGWLTPEGALGRPVDILIQPGGTMYVTDDKAGVVYKITRTSE
ncbi:MAG: PQQ-dependent sugar dehydrogenase [Patescibacteria group bacterium]